jgi:hypothetical protein
MSKSSFDIAKNLYEGNIVENDDLDNLKEYIETILRNCPSYFKIPYNSDFELQKGNFYNNFLMHIIDSDINTFEINNYEPRGEVIELFVGFLKPHYYKKQVLSYNEQDYIGIGILVLHDNGSTFLKTYLTYETPFHRAKKN